MSQGVARGVRFGEKKDYPPFPAAFISLTTPETGSKLPRYTQPGHRHAQEEVDGRVSLGDEAQGDVVK
jgi:hypothetical protein